MPKNYNLFLKGTVGYWNFSSDMVNWVLDKHKDSEVHVLVNSLGGYTHEGVAISSLFKLHGNVHVHFVGHNASAATIAAMGAKHVSIDEDAAFLVHKCLTTVDELSAMNADDLDEYIKKLEKSKQEMITIDSCIAGMYARRCKKTKDELLDLMKVGGWLTPEQALEWGFVDEITRYSEDEATDLSEATISYMSSAGIPLPPDYSKKSSSMIDRFFAFMQSFSNKTPKADAGGASQTTNQMPNKFATLCALLGAALSMESDKLFITEDQAKTIDDTLSERDRTIADLNARIAEQSAKISALESESEQKDKTIAELKKEPASSTSDVHDTDKGEPDKYAPVSEADALAASKAFMDSL